jgi:HSP20 family molecular chaperone IbpA
MPDPQQASIRILHLRQSFVQFEVQPWAPPLNMLETEQAFVVMVELAGVNPANVQIEVQPVLLAIRGVRQLMLPQRLRRLHRIEIAVGPFQVAVPLDSPVDPDQAAARYINGLLEVVLPFAREPSQTRVIIPVREGGRP